ncbi:hypothetical protein [Moritella sp. Urea-trap-13]|uniref:hypothetical protein n=1 Tax=Moritella sp. Urea-trap-13 TaxID=2058327 RepID=UPI000C31EBC1|nr:hypothetical protein [Moritella sp. Urea-trap-13]PKH06352.1 hypothetical protein CXF93_10555 [Moritella sp. Urea-trap-13]
MFLISILATSILLSGCAAKTPFRQDTRAYPERERIEDESRSDEIDKVSYLSRALMEDDNRAEIIEKITKSKIYTGFNAVTQGSIAGTTTHLIAGDLHSQSGHVVQAAVIATSLIFGEFSDGSSEYTGKAWIKGSFEGEPITTKEEAKIALIKQTQKRINALADTLKWDVKCIDGCETTRSLHHFKKPHQTTLNQTYIYQPDEFVALVSFNNGFAPVSVNSPVRALVDKDIAWQTKGTDSYRIHFYAGDLSKEEDGSVKLFNTKNDKKWVHVRNELSETQFGRSLYKIFHSTPYTLWGEQSSFPSVIYYDGTVYSFVSNSRTRLASYTMDVPDIKGE